MMSCIDLFTESVLLAFSCACYANLKVITGAHYDREEGINTSEPSFLR